MEMKFLQPLSEIVKNKIEWNFEEFLNEAKNAIVKYDGIIYEDSQIGEAKADKAKINAYVKSLDDARKQVKAIINEPYIEFEKQIKQVEEVLKNAVNGIDEQVKAYDQRKKDEKREKIQALYDNIFASLKQYSPLEKIWDKTWLNVSVSLSSIEKQLNNQRATILTDMDTISSLKSENEVELLSYYFDTLNLASTISKYNKAKEDKEKAQTLISSRNDTQKPCGVSKSNNEPIDTPIAPTATHKVYTLCLKITTTKDKLFDLKSFLVDNQIEFEKIEN